MQAVDDNPGEPIYDEFQGSELILVNFNKDLFHFVVPMVNNMPTEHAKRIATAGLAGMILEHIEPEFVEKDGFEEMHYAIIVKKYEDK